MTTILNHAQVYSLIKAVGHKRTVLVEGDSGSGKTSLLYELQRDPAFANYHHIPPVDCMQLADGSISMMDLDRERGVSFELPNARFGISKQNQKGVNGAKPIILGLDEIAKPRQFIKDMLAPPILERRIGSMYFPEGSIVCGFTNLSLEGLGDSLQAHMRDRLIIVRMRKPTADEWVLWGADNNIHPSIMAAANQYPIIFESFTDYLPGGKAAGKSLSKENPHIYNPKDAMMDKWVTPRSLHAASDLLHCSSGIDEMTLTAGLEGTLGRAFTGHLMSYIRFGSELPPFVRVCDEPDTCPLPKNPTAQLVQVFQFVTQVKDEDMAEAVSVYVSRMREEMKSIFVSTVANSKRNANFLQSATFGKLLAAVRSYFGS